VILYVLKLVISHQEILAKVVLKELLPVHLFKYHKVVNQDIILLQELNVQIVLMDKFHVQFNQFQLHVCLDILYQLQKFVLNVLYLQQLHAQLNVLLVDFIQLVQHV
jgi:hypothetical protein